jgi:hypothetical protein
MQSEVVGLLTNQSAFLPLNLRSLKYVNNFCTRKPTPRITLPRSTALRAPTTPHLQTTQTFRRDNGLSQRLPRQHRRLQAQRPRQARTPAIRHERGPKGAHPVLYVSLPLTALIHYVRHSNPDYSNTLLNRHVLPQMHTSGQRQERQAGQIRRAVHEAVRGPVFGCEYGGVEGVGEVEGIEREWEGKRYHAMSGDVRYGQETFRCTTYNDCAVGTYRSGGT